MKKKVHAVVTKIQACVMIFPFLFMYLFQVKELFTLHSYK